MSVNHFERDGHTSSGSISRRWLNFEQDYFGFPLQIPLIEIQGSSEGPHGVILAGVHGDELNGIQIIHALTEMIAPERLRGKLMLLPVANVPGFLIQSRYMPDRRDLNRLFPGDKNGSEGSRLAHQIWKGFIEGTDFGIDLHSASYSRWNFPHIRGNMRMERVRMLARSFGPPNVIHSQGVAGSLRKEATRRGIPLILFEAGQSNRFEREVVDIGLSGIWSILVDLEMIDFWPEGLHRPAPVSKYYRKTTWVRSPAGGLFIPRANPGDLVKKGQNLGEVRSAFGEVICDVKAEKSGSVLGFNLHPQVVPGRALYHIAYDEADLD